MKSVYTGGEKVAEFESYDELRVGESKPAFIYEGSELVYPSPVKEGLVLWYDFSGRTNADDQRGIAEDLSGNGNHGTLQNFNYTAESGYDKNKLLFDGVDDYIQVPETGLNPESMAVVENGKIYSYAGDKVTSTDIDGNIVGSNKNLIEKAKLMNRYILHDTGASLSNEAHLGVEYTEIIPEENYTMSSNTGISFARIVFYDADKNFIIGKLSERYEPSLTMKSPPNAKYIRASTGINENQTDIKSLILEKSLVETVYSPSPNDFLLSHYYSPFIQDLLLYNRPLTPEEIAHNYAIEKERFGIE